MRTCWDERQVLQCCEECWRDQLRTYRDEPQVLLRIVGRTGEYPGGQADIPSTT